MNALLFFPILALADIDIILDGLRSLHAPFRNRIVELAADVVVSQIDVDVNESKEVEVVTFEKAGNYESIVAPDGRFIASYPPLGLGEDKIVATFDGIEMHLYLLKGDLVKEHHLADSGKGFVSTPLYKIIFSMGLEKPGTSSGIGLHEQIGRFTPQPGQVDHPTLGKVIVLSQTNTEAKNHKVTKWYFGVDGELAYWKGEEVTTTRPIAHSRVEWPNGVNEVLETKTEIQYQKLEGSLIPRSWSSSDFRYTRDNTGKALSKVKLRRRAVGTVTKFNALESFPIERLRMVVPTSAIINDKRGKKRVQLKCRTCTERKRWNNVCYMDRIDCGNCYIGLACVS